MKLGFFDGLTKTWSNWGTNWGDIWKGASNGVSNLYHGFLNEAATAFNVAQVAFNPGGSENPYADLSQAMTKGRQGLGQLASGAGGVAGAAAGLPVVRQLGETSLWATKEGVNRPLATAELQLGDAYNGKPGNLFSGSAWRSAYDSSRSVTAGQAGVYASLSLGARSGGAIAGMFGAKMPTSLSQDPAWLQGMAKWTHTQGIIEPYLNNGSAAWDPRTAQGQALYHSNPWLKATSGTVDATVLLALDPTKGLGQMAKAGKLKFISKPITSASAIKLAGSDERWASHLDSRSYQKTFDFIQQAKSPEQVRKTLFNDHYSGGVMANALWSVKDDPELYNTTFRALYGDAQAWDDLTAQAPRLAQVTGTKFANYSISQVAKNVGIGDPLADYLSSNKVETDVQAFADAIANSKGFWGEIGKGTKAGGLLVGQNTPRVRLTSQWRAGVNQWMQYGPNTILGQWATDGSNAAYAARRLTRTLLPSSRGGRLLDLTNPDSQRIFVNSLQQSRLSPGDVDNFASMYSRASTAESRFSVVNQAENAAFTVHALAHGVTPAAIDEILPTLNKFRSGNRTFIKANKRYGSSDSRRLATTMAQQGLDDSAMGLTELANDIDGAIEQGRYPYAHLAMPDEDGNLNLIPLDSTGDMSRPILESQYADAMPVQDWGALDSALWWRNRGALGRGIWNTKEATTSLLETAASVWKITAIMRPGYLWRTLSDEAGGPVAVMGGGQVMASATEGVKNAWQNLYDRAQLVPEYVAKVQARSRAGRLSNIARGKELQSSVEDTAPAVSAGLSSHGNDPNYTAYTFGNNQGYTSFDRALADGTLGVKDFMGFFLAHGDEGQLPHDYQVLYNGLKEGKLTKREVQDQVLDHALSNAGMNAYDNPAWQQSVIQAAIDARKSEVKGLKSSFTTAPTEGIVRTPPLGQTEEQLREELAKVRDIEAVKAPPLKWDYELREFERSDIALPEQKSIEKTFADWAYKKASDGDAEPLVNAALRGKVKMTPKIEQDVKNLETALTHSTLSKPITVYRGYTNGSDILPEGWENRDLAGLEWDNAGFLPTTGDVESAEAYAGDAADRGFAIRMRVPEGTGAIGLQDSSELALDHEGEILLPRNMKLRVVKDWGAEEKYGIRWLDVEPVPLVKGKPQGVPGQPVVIDARTGTSPSLHPQRVNHLFSLGDAHVFPADPKHFEEVNKFVHANMDDLLKPSNLLHAYVQPDGNMALSVARYTGGSELTAVKPGSGRRVSLGGVQGKTYRGAGETGWDIRVGPGPNDIIHVRAAFEGPEGDRFRSQVSSRGPMANMTDRITNSQHARLMANTPGEWVNMTSDMKGYDSAWERAANMHLGNDQLARQFIANPPRNGNPGFSIRDAVAWMHNTTEGRAYQARMGAWQSKYYDQIHQVQAMVDLYVPFNEDAMEASDALRKAVLKREAKYSDLAKVRSKDDMPQVHGASLEQATGRGWFSQKSREITDKVFGLISDMPNDKLLRFPFTNNRYQFHVNNLVASRSKWLDSKGDVFTQGDLDAIEGLARKRTLVDTRRYLYDTMASHDLAKGLRLLVPFGSALADSAHKWGVVLKEQPHMAANVWKLWSLPDRSGLVQDQDGNHMEVKDGQETWYKVDPKTGQRTDLGPDFKPNGKVIVFRLPVGGPTVDGHKMPVTISKQAFQTFLDIPTFGPLVTIPANKFAMSHPEFATNKLVQTFILPYGPTNSPITAAIPGNARNWRDAINSWRGVDDQNAEDQAMAVYMAEMVDYSQGKRTNAPTFAESRDKAAKMQMLRFMSRLSGVSSSFQSPYQPYIDYYHQLQQQDPSNADKNFYNQMGQEYFWLTSAVTRNALGIPATTGAFNQYKKFSELMQQFPELAPLISGAEGAGAFNKSVYEAQKSTPIRYGTQKNEREVIPLLQSVSDTQKRLGWVKWGQFNDALMADLYDRGLTSLQQKGAEDLAQAKQNFLTNNMTWRDPYGTTQVSPWYQDYTSQDLSKMSSRLTQMQQVVQDPRLQGRGDIRGLIEYLDARQGFSQYMDQMGVKQLNTASTLNTTAKKTKAQQLTGNLTSQWNEYVFNLKESNPQFAALYDRWLSADDKLDARVLQ